MVIDDSLSFVLKLFQLHRPIRRIQELLPTPIALVGEADVDDRAALGLDRLGDQVHVGLLGGPAALLHVALDAAAHDVFPTALAALALGLDVVKRQFSGGHPLAAILAAVAVTGVDVPPEAFDLFNDLRSAGEITVKPALATP